MKEINRNEYIQYIADHLYESLICKQHMKLEALRNFHLKSKILGDELFEVQQSYFRKNGFSTNKYSMADYISTAAKEFLLSGKSVKDVLRFDHMVPKNIFLNDFIQKTKCEVLTKEYLFEMLFRYYFICTITKEEDAQLSKINMPSDWDKQNPFARYEKESISFLPQWHHI